jgi:molybdopterin molybdotransferase
MSSTRGPRTVDEHVAAVLARVAASPARGCRPQAESAVTAGFLPLDLVAAAGPGLVTADDVVAVTPVPGFDHAAVDGYAVRLADLPAEAPVTLQVAGAVRAGDRGVAALAGRAAVRVMTGAPLPPGADAVVPVEATSTGRFDPGRDGTETTVTLTRPHRDNVRRRGEDLAAGTLLAARGHAVTPALVAATAAADVANLRVAVQIRETPVVPPSGDRVPCVAVISTGSELRPAGAPLGAAGVVDSNSLMITAIVRACGAEVLRVGGVPDDAAALREALDGVADDADLVVTTGGVSAGAWDVVREVLGAPGSPATDVDLTGVAMRPGRPQGLATWRGVPWVALPGTPVAAFVSAHLFVRPAVEALRRTVLAAAVPTGAAQAGPRETRADGRATGGRAARATMRAGAGGWPRATDAGCGGRAPVIRVVPVRATDGAVVPTAGTARGGHALSALLDADSLALVPPEGVRTGDLLHVVPL